MSLDIEAIRRLFPYLQSCLYLNTASVGLSWAGQGAAVARFYDAEKAIGYDGRDAWHATHMRCRDLIAALLKVPAESVSFCSSTTEALNLVARAMRLGAGDEVVVAEDEFPSVHLAWQGAAEAGATIVRVPIRAEDERTDALIAALRDGTRVLAVSHVHWCTGTKVDLSRLSQACRARNIRLIVDGVQAVGAVDVDASLADFYTASVFKWLLAGFGLALMITRPDFGQTLRPGILGYHNEPPSSHLRHSHINYPGVYALHASLEYLGSLGWPDVLARVGVLAKTLREALGAEGFSVVTPSAASAGIVSIVHPNATDAAARLAHQGVRVEERSGLLRAAPHFYNTEVEILRFVRLVTGR
ncbi:MAG TPA: aminotransferase class V-fold PLP-dependent enzyme [Steroidobacteraceae bacterium]|jgi:selenocysteine lyase/cysteine desulfurase|nr:aminotransferase class V-fold PLP-dependent enzyme [Steroidobacteraceae bacterium]